MRSRILERAPQRRVADQELRVRVLVERNLPRLGKQDAGEHDGGRALGRDRDERMRSSGIGETSWIESTAPSEETQSRGSTFRRSAFRAHSIDGIGATSTSPASSFRASSVGTPLTSSTSASSRWKTGAMFT